ncbi:MAG: hypothetical protein DKINENOH_04871 [bacterium]|nr:hypothetical protein [bacterium]
MNKEKEQAARKLGCPENASYEEALNCLNLLLAPLYAKLQMTPHPEMVREYIEKIKELIDAFNLLFPDRPVDIPVDKATEAPIIPTQAPIDNSQSPSVQEQKRTDPSNSINKTNNFGYYIDRFIGLIPQKFSKVYIKIVLAGTKFFLSQINRLMSQKDISVQSYEPVETLIEDLEKGLKIDKTMKSRLSKRFNWHRCFYLFIAVFYLTFLLRLLFEDNLPIGAFVLIGIIPYSIMLIQGFNPKRFTWRFIAIFWIIMIIFLWGGLIDKGSDFYRNWGLIFFFIYMNIFHFILIGIFRTRVKNKP